MDQTEIMDKIKEMISNGNLDDAKSFIEDHKDDLGDYYEKAQDLIGGDAGNIIDGIKGIFGK